MLRTSEYPEYKYSLAFLGYEDGENATEIELTYNWGFTEYDLGHTCHIAIGVDDIYATCEAIRANGGKVTRETGPVKIGTTVTALVEEHIVNNKNSNLNNQPKKIKKVNCIHSFFLFIKIFVLSLHNNQITH